MQFLRRSPSAVEKVENLRSSKWGVVDDVSQSKQEEERTKHSICHDYLIEALPVEVMLKKICLNHMLSQ